MLPYQSPSRVVDFDGRQVAGLFQPDEELRCAPENEHQFATHSTTSREFDHECGARRDRDVDRCTELGADLETIRAAIVRTTWIQTRGVSDPARWACADP